jgi:hypothetical protein
LLSRHARPVLFAALAHIVCHVVSGSYVERRPPDGRGHDRAGKLVHTACSLAVIHDGLAGSRDHIKSMAGAIFWFPRFGPQAATMTLRAVVQSPQAS